MPRYYQTETYTHTQQKTFIRMFLSSTVPKNLIMETTQVFINKRMEELNVVYSQYGVLYSNENE